MKKLTSLMLIELAKTDRAMSWAVRHDRKDIYEEQMNERFGIISDWMDRPKLSLREYINLKIY